MTFSVPGPPVPKPTMTVRDKWKKRDPVRAYFAWRDTVRAIVKVPVTFNGRLTERFYMPMPASWSATRKKAQAGLTHHVKPDLDNLLKALHDAILPGTDQQISEVYAWKVWDDGKGPRTEVEFG